MKWTIIDGLKYTKKHEWVRREDSDLVTVGLTDYAQDKLGEIVFVELPDVGAAVEAGKGAAVVESVKAVADLYAPADGEIAAVNEDLLDQPELINREPYEGGWVLKIKVVDGSQVDALMDKTVYEGFVAEEEEK